MANCGAGGGIDMTPATGGEKNIIPAMGSGKNMALATGGGAKRRYKPVRLEGKIQ